MADKKMDMMSRLSGNNPGALKVMASLRYYRDWIDMLKWLDKNGYRGDKLWELYKDICKEDIFILGQLIRVNLFKEKEKGYIPVNIKHILKAEDN